MRITATAGVLAEQLTWAAKMLPARPAIPILAGIRLDIAPDQVRITATDYEVWGTAALEADTTDTGTVILPGRLLADLVSRLPASRTLTLTTEEARVRIACGPVSATVRTFPTDDYPDPPERPATELGTMAAADLADAVDRTSVAVSNDATLPMLAGLHLEFGPTGLVVEGTDRYRIGHRTVPWSPTLPDPSEPAGDRPVTALIPSTALALAAKSMTGILTLSADLDTEATATVLAVADQARFLVMRPLDAAWVKTAPFHDKALNEAAVQVVADTGELLDAIDRARLFADTAPVHLTTGPDQVTVHGGADGEDASEDLSAAVTALDDGEPKVTVAFSHRYLTDALRACRADTVRLLLRRTPVPALLVPETDDATYWHVVMPVRQ
ncbi:DNA polymerase III subunit beta [Nocardiopsis sp. CC223A]|uniref:DNA polymerase III subunit beta n=1 Tax=Nocardiopsis sp. CC223A TaxID=3044051 RepID=UPI00278C5C8A|nr:DNA polymerase III subunit beta [Nocardiopsis sp. CC223A]